MHTISRRCFTKSIGVSLLSTSFLPTFGFAGTDTALVKKNIPTGDEKITVIGLGTWQTFNVGSDVELRDRRTEVLRAFFDLGGQVVDSSPMYGSSQDVLGYALNKLSYPNSLFSAEKVWTGDGDATRRGVTETSQKWGVDSFDLVQVHNLLGWKSHLDALTDMKKEGIIRYLGVTTSHGRRHRELERILSSKRLDFVQLTYNCVDREAEDRLLPLARERGTAVIVNRPFQGGRLVGQLQRQAVPLPAWANDYACTNWPQLLLKFIISHPAVTCAIPATTQVEHVRENMGAARGPMLDEKTRGALVRYIESI
jgi:diketogulonate reductase-like aldo/keto reductase